MHCVLDEGERILVGTGRGLELLAPDGRRLRRFTRADGLPNDEVFAAHRDRSGQLWFGTLDGMARLDRLARSIEQTREPGADVARAIEHERRISKALGGRTVFDDRRPVRREAGTRQTQLPLFEK